MSKHNYNDAEVEISVRLPGKTHHERRAIRIAGKDARLLATLPRDREFDCMSAQASYHIMTERRRLATEIAQQFTLHLLALFAEADTINGYTPEEWAEMNRPGDGEFRSLSKLTRG